MITRVHHNGVKTIALRLEALRQQLERIVDEVDAQGTQESDEAADFVYALMVDHDDLHAVISRMNETVHDAAKYLGVEGREDTHNGIGK